MCFLDRFFSSTSLLVVCMLACSRVEAELMASPASVNGDYDPTIDPKRKAKSKDPGWKYGYTGQTFRMEMK